MCVVVTKQGLLVGLGDSPQMGRSFSSLPCTWRLFPIGCLNPWDLVSSLEPAGGYDVIVIVRIILRCNRPFICRCLFPALFSFILPPCCPLERIGSSLEIWVRS
eukprot:21058_6